MAVKGNEVRSNRNGKDGLVLAVTKDGKRCRVYIYGSDGMEVWVPVSGVTVTVSGDDQCWKCGGSGIFYISGATVNGVFQGSSGKCYGCEGKGVQNNGDRLRNHGYHHRRAEVEERVAAAERGEQVKPLSHPKVTARKSARKNHPDPERKLKRTVHGVRSTTPATDAAEREPRLIDCECGFMHLDSVPCI